MKVCVEAKSAHRKHDRGKAGPRLSAPNLTVSPATRLLLHWKHESPWEVGRFPCGLHGPQSPGRHPQTAGGRR